MGGGNYVLFSVVIVLVVFVVVVWFVYCSCFGCMVYVLGGNECFVLLMGLLVVCMCIFVYVFSGFCLVLGGVLVMFYMFFGYGLYV